jgi:hypothetical protein
MAEQASSPERHGSFSDSPNRGGEFRGRGSLDYLLRTTQQGQFQLNAMADAKANIIITVASIVFSLTLTRLGEGTWLFPQLTLCIASGAALVTAILAVLPADTSVSKAPAPTSSAFNLLFFGHFQQLTKEEFTAQIGKASQTDDSLYQTMCADVYGVGTLLAQRKYKRLRLAYLFMIAGVLVAGVSALGVLLTH